MTWKRFTSYGMAAATTLILSTALSFGQDQFPEKWTYKGEVFGSVGGGWLYHGNNHLLTGFGAGGGVGVRPFTNALSGLGFEGRFGFLGSDTEMVSDIWMFSGVAVYHFGKSRVQPYVLGGIGALRGETTVTTTYGDEEGNYTQEFHQASLNKLGLELGGGVKVALTPSFSIRPEFRVLDTTARQRLVACLRCLDWLA
jgi:opacity protein-like surface antigen